MVFNMEEIIKLNFNVPEDRKYIRIMAIGDVHYGNKYHDKDMFPKFMKQALKDKDMYILSVGDLIECATKRSLGLQDQVIPVMDQVEDMIEILKPFADENRVIGLINGNHENRAMKEASIDVSRLMSKALDVRYLGIGAILYMSVKGKKSKRGQNYTIYATHGFSGARTAGGKMNACMRLRDVVDADLYLHGHVHSLDHHTEEVFTIDRGNLQLKKKHYVLTGGYLKYWGSYAQGKAYPPSGTSGSPKIKFHSGMKRISVVI